MSRGTEARPFRAESSHNVRLSLRLLANTGWRRLMVISDVYHLPRALWTFRRYGVAVTGSAPEPPPSFPLWSAQLREACAFPLTVWKVARRSRP